MAFEPEANIVKVGMAADVVVSATVVVTSVVVGSAVVVSVLKSVMAETADDVSAVVGESDVSADEADVVVKDTYVSVEETYVSVEDSTTVEEVAPSSLVVDAKGVKTEVSVEASEVTVVDVVATEVVAEVVEAETNHISVLNQLHSHPTIPTRLARACDSRANGQ